MAEMLPEGRLNLTAVKALCVDSNSQGLEILTQTLTGFGVDKLIRAHSAEEARKALRQDRFDIMLADARLTDESGYDLLRWLRRSTLEHNRFVPVILVTGHTRESQVQYARDSGANFVVAKPTSPIVLLQRIQWVARGGRVFVESDTFVGPDRRFKHEGLPNGVGRRSTDASEALGDTSEPNMTQSEIDTVFRPQRVSL
jgi:DNA-binding response OmpR family regulator